MSPQRGSLPTVPDILTCAAFGLMAVIASLREWEHAPTRGFIVAVCALLGGTAVWGAAFALRRAGVARAAVPGAVLLALGACAVGTLGVGRALDLDAAACAGPCVERLFHVQASAAGSLAGILFGRLLARMVWERQHGARERA